MPSFTRARRRLLPLFGSVLILAGLLPASTATLLAAAPTELFFSEYIEGTSNNKALEIYNGTGAPVDLTTGGYSVQMFFNGNASAGLTVNLTGSVADGDVFVFAQSSAGAAILAQADQTNGAGWFNGDDAVVLRKGTTVVDVIGQIGFDPGTEWGTSLTSTADNTLRRTPSICGGDTNGGDAFDPVLQWNGFVTDTFDGLGVHNTTCSETAPFVSGTTPANGGSNVAHDSNVSITFSEPVDVAGSWFSISCGSSGPHTAVVTGGFQTYSLNPDADFDASELCSGTVFAAQVVDRDTEDPPNNMAADHTFTFTTAAPPVRIHDIQGASHTSPLNTQNVSGVVGIVTAKRSNGYYMQDPSPDATDATSEGIFVFTSSAPTSVAVGDSVRVSARVREFRAGGASSTNLTITELVSPTTIVLSSGAALPAPTVAGNGGRIPPGTVIEDDASGSVETSGVFDPATDGIDFYESLEHMRLQVNDAVAVGPENNFGEIFVLGDDGANATVRTARGGIVIRLNDFNPERIQLDDAILAGSTPAANVGDHFSAPAVGILDYDFGNFELNLTSALATVSGGLTRESTDPQGPKQISIATYNVENLDANEPQLKFDTLAGQIINNLRSPDVVALEEIQDNNGATNDSVVDANLTLDRLVAAIQSAGGPAYQWRQINPVDDQDGGEPGGNIRVAFLFRTDRGVEFIDRPGGDSVTPTTVVNHPSGPRLSFSPGRVFPAHTAWNASRKPLAAEFKIRNRKFFIIANHFNSKGGDQPLFGRFQPPTRSSEVQRHQQAQIVNDFVDSILAVDPNAHVVVLGDINDFQFSDTVTILKGGVLNDLVDTLPPAERYSYDFEGNAQVLDHILVSNATFRLPFAFDAVHANSEFADQASDHDPNIVRIALNSPPKAGTHGP